MPLNYTREQRRQLERDNAKQPLVLTDVPRELWPQFSVTPARVLRSRDFLVQIYPDSGIVLDRLTISRTSIKGERWYDGITWDDLQRVKRECGYGNMDAVEVFPADEDIVNVANMRHLWIMRNQLPFAWRRKGFRNDAG